jgi:signal transduction histidine kinase
LNDSTYALKNALLYTFLVALILLAPLYVYALYSKNIFEIQNEITLKEHANLIIRSMEEYDATRHAAYEYPRFKRIESGLYDLHYKPIFTLIERPFSSLNEDYHIYDGYAYLVLSLPKNRYFGAEYLIVGNRLSYAPVYLKVATILLSIVFLILFLSFFFLNRFALPFKRVNEKLDNFIKDSMHEINTPLSIINVNIDLHNRKFPSSKYLQRIKAATKTLSTIYDDMDYLIKNRRLVFEKEPINMKVFLQDRVNYFYEVAQMKSVELVILRCDEVTLYFNATQLQRLIDNNISNAIKYSHAESKVEISLHDTQKGCEIVFKDYGIGMKDPKQIFKRYYRESTQVGGFGIGLNIVKSIMDEHDIVLHVSSVYQEGSTFIYTFPQSMKRSI